MMPFGDLTVGFLGLGRIGSGVLARLKAFGFRFLVADPQLDAAQAETLGATRVDRHALFAQSDVTPLPAPAPPQTPPILNEARLPTQFRHTQHQETRDTSILSSRALRSY